MVTWHLTMKLFPAKCPERATLRKLRRQTGNSSLLPAKCLTAVARDQSVQLKVAWFCRRNPSAFFKICFLSFFCYYNKSLNDWSVGKQWILFPSNLNVSLDFVSGNIEILGKQNSLFPLGPVTKCLLFPKDIAKGRKFSLLILHKVHSFSIVSLFVVLSTKSLITAPSTSVRRFLYLQIFLCGYT